MNQLNTCTSINCSIFKAICTWCCWGISVSTIFINFHVCYFLYSGMAFKMSVSFIMFFFSFFRMASADSARYVYRVVEFMEDHQTAVVSNTWLFDEDVSTVYVYRVATPPPPKKKTERHTSGNAKTDNIISSVTDITFRDFFVTLSLGANYFKNSAWSVNSSSFDYSYYKSCGSYPTKCLLLRTLIHFLEVTFDLHMWIDMLKNLRIGAWSESNYLLKWVPRSCLKVHRNPSNLAFIYTQIGLIHDIFSFFVCKKHVLLWKINDFPQTVCVYFSTSKPRPPKKLIYYQLVSRDRMTSTEEGVCTSREEGARGLLLLYTILRRALFCYQKFLICSFISADKWKMLEAIPQMMEWAYTGSQKI